MGFQVGTFVADDTLYKEALAKREEILRQMEQLQTDLLAVEEFIRLYDRIFVQETALIGDHAEARIIRAADRQNSDRPKKKRDRNVLSPARIVEMCKQFILKENRPLNRSQLLKQFHGLGIPLAGADPSKNLGTILWRSREFDHIDGEGYWPIGSPRPQTML